MRVSPDSDQARAESSALQLRPRVSSTGQFLELFEVIEIVTGHGLDDGEKGHGAAFGMRERSVRRMR